MKVIQEFVDLVKKYLALVDGLPGPTARDFLLECAILLPQIYSLGQQLPDVELPEDDPLEEKTGSIDGRMDAIMRQLGKYDSYSEVLDPVYDTDAITTSLSDDLSDVYRDLKGPLIKYESGEEPNQRIAIWEWRFNLQGHCGDHLVDSLRPIHRLVYDHMDPEYKAEEETA